MSKIERFEDLEVWKWFLFEEYIPDIRKSPFERLIG